jgi:hypothetical protein
MNDRGVPNSQTIMNNAGFSKILGLILLAIAGGASYYLVDHVWKLKATANMRLAYLGGGAVAGFVVLSFFCSFFSGRKPDHLGEARQALEDGDPVTASETVYPLLRRCLGDDSKFSDEAFSLLEEAYDQAEIEVDIVTLRDIHRQMSEIAVKHKTGDGLIQDADANAAFNQLNAEAEAVIQSFPRLG